MESKLTDNEKNMFRALIATDIHLGFAEKDSLRGDDTFNTFEEVLQIASDNNVDFVILGGDLFHENKPSSKSMTRCMELLRKYCTGQKAIEFQVVSDQKENFRHTQLFPFVNYEDSNINISIPVFSIHGNHDDPIGKDHLCALETISAAGLINYFGKSLNVDELVLSPILLKKGGNQIALFGFGFLPEERLHRLFYNNKVKFKCPEGSDDWFKIFVVHQNRVKHGTKYLPEKFLTSLPDLVIWGHEHESFDNVEWNLSQKFFVYQPGSTVVTSLCPAEARPKHVGLLNVFHNGNENIFKITPISLKTTRNFYFESLNVDDIFLNLRVETNAEALYKYCSDKVEDILHKAAVDHSGDERQPKEPLIRLRVDYSDEYLTFSPYHFGQQFVNRVANPKEIVLFKLKKNQTQQATAHTDYDALDELMEADQSIRYNIEDVIKEYFEKVDRKGQLNILCENMLTQSVKLLVEKDASADIISQVIDKRFTEIMKDLDSCTSINCEDKNAVTNACFEFKEKQKRDSDINIAEFLKSKVAANNSVDIADDSDEETFMGSSSSMRGGRAMRTSRRGPRAKGNNSSRGRGKQQSLLKPLFD